MRTRPLTQHDAETFQQARLHALSHDGTAFLSDFNSEKFKSVANFASDIRQAAYTPPFGYYGCFEGDTLIGYSQLGNSVLSKQAHVSYIYNLYIEPDFRGQGIASQLLSTLIEISRDNQLEILYVNCFADNQPGLSLYKKAGFREYGRKPHSAKWQATYNDEVELYLSLTEGP
ncbi:MAG: GNAT family N-acetyltransferase [bacterium]|nr:GNAT family N-acetyltransferase [bacterium]